MRYRLQPQSHPKKHIWFYRVIIAALDLTCIPTVVSAIVSASFGESMSNAVVALQVAGMTGTAGFPIPTHLKR